MGKALKRVLIIDDEEVIRTSLEILLEDFSFEIVTASNGEEGIEAVNKSRFSIAIVDMTLPDTNGDILIERLNKLDKSLKFIIHTGIPNYALTSRLKELGLSKKNILLKPVLDAEGLPDLINSILNE